MYISWIFLRCIYIYMYTKIYTYIYISHPKFKFPKKKGCFQLAKTGHFFHHPQKITDPTRSTSSAVVAWRKATAKRSQRSKVSEVMAPPTVVGPVGGAPGFFAKEMKCWACLTYDWTKKHLGLGGWTIYRFWKKIMIVKMGSSSPIFGLNMKKKH